MKQRISLPFAFVLIAAFLGGCSTELTEEEYLARANSAYEKGDFKSASIDLKNVLRSDPNNVQARWLRGLIFLESGNESDAEGEFLRARAAGLDDASLLVPLAESYLGQTKTKEVLSLLPPPGLTGPILAKFYAIRGTAYLLDGDLSSAKNEVNKAMAIQAKHPYVLTALARTQLKEGLIEEAIGSLKVATEYEASTGPAWSLLGDVYAARGQIELAESAYSEALNDRSQLNYATLQRGLVRAFAKKLPEAKKDLATLTARGIRHYRVSFLKGVVAFYEKDFDTAIEAFQAVLKSDDTMVSAHYYVGSAYAVERNYNLSLEHLRRFVAVRPRNIAGRRALALVNYRVANYQQAKELLTPLAKSELADTESLQIYAATLLQLKEYKDAISALRRAAEKSPDSTNVKRSLAYGLFIVGEEERAFEIMTEAFSESGKGEDAALLVTQYLSHDMQEKAAELAESFYQSNKQNTLAKLLIALVAERAGDLTRAESLYHEILRSDEKEYVAVERLVKLLVARDENQEAVSILEGRLKDYPSELPSRLMLLQLLAKLDETSRWKTALEQGLELHPDDAGLWAIKIVFEAKRDISTSLSVIDKAPISVRNDPRILPILTRIRIENGLYEEAIASANELVSRDPGHLEALELLAIGYERIGDDRGLKRALTRILAINEQHTAAHLGMARLSALKGELSAAEDSLNHLSQNAKKSFDAELTRLVIHKRKGQIHSYERIAKSLEARAENEDHLARLFITLAKVNDVKMAQGVAGRWLSDHPGSEKILMYRALLCDEVGDGLCAERDYRRLLKINSGNVLALNNLSLLSLESSPEYAESLAEKAYELAQKEPRIVDTYAFVLLRNNKLDRAKDIINAFEADGVVPYPLRYRMAQIYKAGGEIVKAKELLNEILASGPEKTMRAKAESLLETL